MKQKSWHILIDIIILTILRVRQTWDMIWSLQNLAVWFRSILIGQ